MKSTIKFCAVKRDNGMPELSIYRAPKWTVKGVEHTLYMYNDEIDGYETALWKAIDKCRDSLKEFGIDDSYQFYLLEVKDDEEDSN